jgi:hypothetical protein
MGFFDELYNSATDAVSNLDLSDNVQALANAYFDAQRSNVVQMVKVGPDPAAAALQPSMIALPAGVKAAVSKIPPWLPIVAAAGLAAYLIFKRK